MIDLTVTMDLTDLVWQSDWNGDEVGHDDVLVVGLYTREHNGRTQNFYIDTESSRVLEFWEDHDSPYEGEPL